jgi:hypothetical protein
MKKNISLLIITITLASALIALFLIRKHYPIVIENFPKFAPHPTPLSGINGTLIVPTPLSGVTGTLSVPTPTTTQKSSVNLPVPFTAQAPTGNWDTLHNEACEEASAIMAMTYYNDSYKNITKLDSNFVEEQLTKLTDWEMQTFGYNLDINSEETVKMITANYPLNAKVQNNFTFDDIKKELNQNHLVLIPVNGQLIGNPNYKQPGPKYHVLVIRGYSDASVGTQAPSGAAERSALLITNDPGTRNGQNYIYDFKTLYDANGNWDHNTERVDLAQKNIIIISK